MDNISIAPPAQVTIDDNNSHNTPELTAAPTQLTIDATHTQNITDTDTKNYDEENGWKER